MASSAWFHRHRCYDNDDSYCDSGEVLQFCKQIIVSLVLSFSQFEINCETWNLMMHMMNH